MLCKSFSGKNIFKNFYVNCHKILFNSVKKRRHVVKSPYFIWFLRKSVKFLIAFLAEFNYNDTCVVND